MKAAINYEDFWKLRWGIMLLVVSSLQFLYFITQMHFYLYPTLVSSPTHWLRLPPFALTWSEDVCYSWMFIDLFICKRNAMKKRFITGSGTHACCVKGCKKEKVLLRDWVLLFSLRTDGCTGRWRFKFLLPWILLASLSFFLGFFPCEEKKNESC